MKRKNILLINTIAIVTFVFIFFVINISNNNVLKDLNNTKVNTWIVSNNNAIDYKTRAISLSGAVFTKVKLWFLTKKNIIDNIVTYCDYAEGKTDFIIEWDDKVKLIQKEKFDLYSLISTGIDLDYEWTLEEKEKEKENVKSLLSWVVPEKYKYFDNTDIKNIDMNLFNDDKGLFLNSLWIYMFSIKDNQKFDDYTTFYLDYLQKNHDTIDKRRQIITENNIFPILNAYIKHYWNCNEFVNKNFIEY
jgi:hypothetical protein